jgi:predicted dehydrogenase
MNQLRIGFLSTAGIGRKNWKAILHSGNCVVSAVASRDARKSHEFIRQCQAAHPFPRVPAAFGSYDALLASPEVDAVYVPLPTALRREFVVRAAAAGKHVLCEKPCAANVAELEAMLAACNKNSVQFMDGVMFMHNPRLARVRQALDDSPDVGPIRRIASAFTFSPNADFSRTNIRANGALEPAGCLGDLGWYCLRFSLWALRWQMPESVTGKILSQSENLPGRPSSPMEFAGTLYYPDGVTAEFYASFRAAKQQWAHVGGQNGWLRMPDFVQPFNSYEPGFELNEKMISVPSDVKCPPDADPSAPGHATAQDTRMWRNFANQIFSGKLTADWPRWSLLTQKVMDACFESAKRNPCPSVPICVKVDKTRINAGFLEPMDGHCQWNCQPGSRWQNHSLPSGRTPLKLACYTLTCGNRSGA